MDDFDFEIIIRMNDPAKAVKFISLLPGATPLGTKPVDETKLDPPADPFVAPPPPPSPLVMSHLDKITDLQLKDICSKKADEYKAVGKDGYPAIKNLISEHGELGKGVNAIHDSRRAAFKAAVEALVP
jgi:hypothetical protein